MMPSNILTPIIREAIKPIAQSHHYKTNIPSLDENNKLVRETDWRETIYGSKYPKSGGEDYMYFPGQPETVINRIIYKTIRKH